MLSLSLGAQQSYGGHPYGLLVKELKSNQLAPKIAIEDLVHAKKKPTHNSQLIATAHHVDIKEDAGRWTQISDQRWVWQVSIIPDDDQSISFLFSGFKLPEHARLFIYSDRGSRVMGAFTHQNNRDHAGFYTDMIAGEEITIEYDVLISKQPKLPFVIDKLYVADTETYRGASSMEIDTGFLASNLCHPNANCPEGDGLDDQKRSLCRILMVLDEGLVYCTGSLLNNSRQDQRPLVLSGFHCQDYFTPLHQFWRFDFNFVTETCENPISAPPFNRITGCRQVAGYRESDMLLLELATIVPASYDVYYNGWDRRNDYRPIPSKHLHHPLGDVMKVSIDTNDLNIHPQRVRWDNNTVTPSDHHFRAVLDIGAHEIGSSGGPLFDSAGRVVGQLHGGQVDSTDCGENRAFFGRVAVSWEGGDSIQNRLKDWLDPLEMGMTQMDGMSQASNSQFYNLKGRVLNREGIGISNVEMLLRGDGMGSTFTGMDGSFVFENVPNMAVFSVTPEINDTAINGVSSVDIVLAQRTVLGLREFSDDLQRLAADVNGDERTSAVDLVQMVNVVLELSPNFSSNQTWGFLPKSIILPGENDLEFRAYKLGDLNFSATEPK